MRLRFLVPTLWITLFASDAAAEPSAYARAIERAVAAYNAGAFADAREHFGEAHALRPNARSWRGMGTSDFELARWSEAVEELTRALEDTRSPLTAELRARTEAQLEAARSHLPPPVVEAPPTPPPLPAVVEETAVEETAEAPPVVAPGEPTRRFGVLRGVAFGSLAVSVAGFALATGYGLRSMHEGDTRDRYCDQGACSDARGLDAGNAARRTGNLASAGWIVGGVGLASAVTLFWVDRAKRADRAQAQLRLGPTSIAIAGTL